MSLRKSPRLTPQLLEATRRNAQHSTGARSAAGKRNSKLNALKHGERADPANHHDVMRALGEDPAQFEALRQGLRESLGPAGALLEKQADDLALLYWRRQRLERTQEGVMRRALVAIEAAQHRRRLEIEGATFHAGQAINIEMSLSNDPGVRLRLLLSFLSVIREQVRARSFLAWQASELESLYGKKRGWRPARLCHLLSLFAGSASRLLEDEESQELPMASAEAGDEAASGSLSGAAAGADELLAAATAPAEPAEEPQYRELLQLLEEEMAGVQEEFEYEEKLNEEKAAIERDACLAPEGEQWKMMLRREETLDRSIDRKLKLLLSLRHEAGKPEQPESLRSRSLPPDGEVPRTPAQDGEAPLVGAHAEEKVGPEGRPYHEPETRDQKIDERTGNVMENKGRSWKRAAACRQETNGKPNDRADNLTVPAPPIWELR